MKNKILLTIVATVMFSLCASYQMFGIPLCSMEACTGSGIFYCTGVTGGKVKATNNQNEKVYTFGSQVCGRVWGVFESCGLQTETPIE